MIITKIKNFIISIISLFCLVIILALASEGTKAAGVSEGDSNTTADSYNESVVIDEIVTDNVPPDLVDSVTTDEVTNSVDEIATDEVADSVDKVATDNVTHSVSKVNTINSQNTSTSNEIYYCNATSLQIRATPSTSGEVIGSLIYGDSVTVTKKADWAKVLFNNKVGYICSKYLADFDTFQEELLGKICYAEAGGCDKAEMARVGRVVLNRVNTSYSEFKHCNSIYDVVTMKGHYPETWEKILNGLTASEDAKSVAKGLLNGSITSELSDDVLWQTGFIPSWDVRVIFKSEWHYYSVKNK